MAVDVLVQTVLAIEPSDEVERAHRADVLTWLDQTDDVYRRVAPAVPPKHLVSYFLVRDPSSGSVLLVHHRKAGKWLPTGGHVEPEEHPKDTVRREALEELGITAEFASPAPMFLTVTRTVGARDSRHVDVSLWYLLHGDETAPLQFDAGEFLGARWWTVEDVIAADPAFVEPHLLRFLRKLD